MQPLMSIIVALTPSVSQSPSPQSPMTWGRRINQTGLDSNPSTSPPAVRPQSDLHLLIFLPQNVLCYPYDHTF